MPAATNSVSATVLQRILAAAKERELGAPILAAYLNP